MQTMPKRLPYRTTCKRCQRKFTRQQLGHRKDGRRNGHYPSCRQESARAAGELGAKKAADYVPRDERALRKVEQYSGFARGTWRTPEAQAWERQRGYTLHELWSHWMRELAAAETKSSGEALADG